MARETEDVCVLFDKYEPETSSNRAFFQNSSPTFSNDMRKAESSPLPSGAIKVQFSRKLEYTFFQLEYEFGKSSQRQRR